MKTLLTIITFSITLSAYAESGSKTPEVESFIHNRDLCDHFRGEPFEGNSPEQIERRKFVFESLDIYCAGTDKRLAALKRRYKNNNEIIKRLSRYEISIE